MVNTVNLTRKELAEIIRNECNGSKVDDVSGIRELVKTVNSKLLLKELVFGCREIRLSKSDGYLVHPNSTLRKSVYEKFELFCIEENIRS